MPAGLGAALIGAPAAHASLLFPEQGGSPNANSIHTLYVMVFVLALVVFIGVEGTLLYSFFRFRARKGRVAAQIQREMAASDDFLEGVMAFVEKRAARFGGG